MEKALFALAAFASLSLAFCGCTVFGGGNPTHRVARVLILPSEYHWNEFDGALDAIGAEHTLLKYEDFSNGTAFDHLDDYDVVAMPPLFNYKNELDKMPEGVPAKLFVKLRKWIEKGGVFFLPDANYPCKMDHDWQKMLDPELMLLNGEKNGANCDCKGPAFLTKEGDSFGPLELQIGLSWMHLVLDKPELWTVLSTCGHGKPTSAVRSYGKGTVYYTVLRDGYQELFRNLFVIARLPEYGRIKRLPALPEPAHTWTVDNGTNVLTVSADNLKTMPVMDVIAGTYKLLSDRIQADRSAAIRLMPVGDSDVVNFEIRRFADGKSSVSWGGNNDMKADPMSRTRILSEGYGSYNWWMNRFIGSRREILASEGHIDLVLMGDSITHNWEGPGVKYLNKLRGEYSVLSAGNSGDGVAHLRWLAENGDLDGYEAGHIAILIGTNDIQFWTDLTPEMLASAIKDTVKVIRAKQPNAKILVSSIFPRGEKPDDPLRLKVVATNKALADVADGEHVFYTTFGESYLSKDGTIARSVMGDFLHPGTGAYDIWYKTLLDFCRK